MIKAVLFDLDDTLLKNDMNVFMRSYLPLLAEYVAPQVDGGQFITDLMASSQAMIDNTDRSMTNREVFWSDFSQRTGIDRQAFEPYIDQFYLTQFSKLRSVTGVRPVAKKIVEFCFEQGFFVVIATNPLFPQRAVEQRLAWAGLPVDRYQFDLVTTYENMHAAKPHALYYQEVLDQVGVGAKQAVMVGDDWHNDIVPASALGMVTYWITADDDEGNEASTKTDAAGSLESFYDLIRDGWLTEPQNRV